MLYPATGLATREVRRQRELFGANHMGHSPLPGWPGLMFRQLASPIIWLLAAATAMSMILGDVVEGCIILTIILASTGIGFWQEHQAGLAMNQLAERLDVDTEVIRDGVCVSIPVTEVVVGDLVVLRAGDLVPADMTLTEANSLLLDEAIMTGESEPVEKLPGDEPGCELWQGTHVLSGSGRGVIQAVGKRTRYGAMTGSIERSSSSNTFERGTAAFGRMLVWTTAVLAMVLLGVNLALGRSWLEGLMFSLALAVGLTPQMLPAIVAVSMSTGARRLARAAVLVRRQDSIAELGGMTVLCCDKTGTLTEGTVRLRDAVDVQSESSPRILRLAGINASLQTGFDNPVDDAILAGGALRDLPMLRQELPYDFARRMLTVVVDDGSSIMAITKGAFASVLPACSRIRVRDEVYAISPHTEAVRRQFASLSIQGLRVLALATRPWDRTTAMTTRDECDLTLEGLLVFEDPVKIDAGEAVTSLANLGITVRLITGDNALAARQAAEAVGLEADRIISGTQLSMLSGEAFSSAVRQCRVFAEVDPLGKERIVRALSSSGESVGVLGDGINDVAALHIADVGITVESAVDCARQAASIVLLNKDLHVLANGVRAGRQTFANTLKYVHVTISANFGNMMSMVIATTFLPFLPLLPVQILLLNFLSDIPALTISTDTVDAEEVRRPTAWDIRDIRRFMIAFGCISSIADLMLFFVLDRLLRLNAAGFQSTWFVASTLTELTALLVLRTRRAFWRSRPSTLLLGASAVVALVTCALPFLGIGTRVGLVPLMPWSMVALVSVTLVYVLGNEGAKALRRRDSDGLETTIAG